jgi:hypothetical protein
MLLTLLKALGSKSLDEVVSKISLSPLDIDVLLYEAQEAGDVEVNREKNTIKPLKEPNQLYYNDKLLSQIKKIIRFYDQQEANIVRSRLEMVAVDPMGVYGYPKHDFYCTLYYLEQSGEVNKYDISVRKRGSRPAHTFEFYTFLDHQEFGAKAVNNFIEQFDKK